jgi:hypothetical protein
VEVVSDNNGMMTLGRVSDNNGMMTLGRVKIQSMLQPMPEPGTRSQWLLPITNTETALVPNI